ncbi:hypothetical protein NLJ89_g11991 [Agrocybe chaxingu]|uniref:Uncharacterized protein n=1 Tax=Agrocybe chaxingu TaxID=84603 RepID=A0A9W8JNC1_9AGAR|nr:hypothetical protein NLJ89_g11991 [Agrocybe chaxingu]
MVGWDKSMQQADGSMAARGGNDMGANGVTAAVGMAAKEGNDVGVNEVAAAADGAGGEVREDATVAAERDVAEDGDEAAGGAGDWQQQDDPGVDQNEPQIWEVEGVQDPQNEINCLPHVVAGAVSIEC